MQSVARHCPSSLCYGTFHVMARSARLNTFLILACVVGASPRRSQRNTASISRVMISQSDVVARSQS